MGLGLAASPAALQLRSELARAWPRAPPLPAPLRLPARARPSCVSGRASAPERARPRVPSRHAPAATSSRPRMSSPPVITAVHAPAAPPDRPRAHPHAYCTPARPQRAPLAALMRSTRELPCLLSERPSNQLQTPWDPARTLAAGLSGPARGVGVGPGAWPPEKLNPCMLV
jgi:hypothetical protein